MDAEYRAHLLRDELATCAMSPHLVCELFEKNGLTLPVVRIPDVSALDAVFQERLGVAGTSSALSLIGGGVAQLRSFCLHRNDESEHRGTASMEDLLQDTVHNELRSGAQVVTLSAAPQALPLLTRIPGTRTRAQPAVSHYVMRLRGYRSLDDYVGQQPAPVRKVWRRDLRDVQRAELSFTTEPLSARGCADAAPFLAETARRYGDESGSLTSEWRLASRMRRPGEHLLMTIRAGGEAVAYVAVTVNPNHLDAHTVGVAPDSEHRQTAYQSLYRACAELAVDRGLDFVAFGHGNAHPKTSRGCVEVPQWRVEYSPESHIG